MCELTVPVRSRRSSRYCCRPPARCARPDRDGCSSATPGTPCRRRFARTCQSVAAGSGCVLCLANERKRLAMRSTSTIVQLNHPIYATMTCRVSSESHSSIVHRFLLAKMVFQIDNFSTCLANLQSRSIQMFNDLNTTRLEKALQSSFHAHPADTPAANRASSVR